MLPFEIVEACKQHRAALFPILERMYLDGGRQWATQAFRYLRDEHWPAMLKLVRNSKGARAWFTAHFERSRGCVT